MSATGLNLNLYKSQNFILTLTAKDGTTANNPINLSGYSCSGYAKYTFSSPPFFNFNPTIHSSYVSGLINVNVPVANTQSLPEGRFPYLIYIFTNTGNITTLLQGNLYIHPTINA